MGKIKKGFFCQICGTQHTKWQGQCNGCKDWNTIVEEIFSKETNELWGGNIIPSRTSPIQINNINVDLIPRFISGDKELDNVLGGGLVPGSVTLLGGEPGIGLQKKEYLVKQHPDNIPLMKLIKKSFDPNNIMNPGKVFD